MTRPIPTSHDAQGYVSADTFGWIADRIVNLARSDRTMTVMRQAHPQPPKRDRAPELPSLDIHRDAHVDTRVTAEGYTRVDPDTTGSAYRPSVSVPYTCDGPGSGAFGVFYDPEVSPTEAAARNVWNYGRGDACYVEISGGLDAATDRRDDLLVIHRQNQYGYRETVTVIFHMTPYRHAARAEAALLTMLADARPNGQWTSDELTSLAASLTEAGRPARWVGLPEPAAQ